MNDSQRGEVMTTDAAAAALNVSLRWLEKLIDGRLLGTVRVDGEVRVPAEDVLAYAEARR